MDHESLRNRSFQQERIKCREEATDIVRLIKAEHVEDRSKAVENQVLDPRLLQTCRPLRADDWVEDVEGGNSATHQRDKDVVIVLDPLRAKPISQLPTAYFSI